MASTSDIKNGLCLEYNGNLYFVTEFQHVKPGKGPAFVRTKLKSVTNGKVIENTLKISELYLRSSGYLLLILPTNETSVLKDGSYPNENIFRKKLKNQHEIIQEINLTDFFKNSTLFLCKKK